MSAPAIRLASSAPHIRAAADLVDGLAEWGPHQTPIDGRSLNRGRLLFKGEDGLPEAGLWRSTPGSWRLVLPADELCYFLEGRALYSADDGEEIHCAPGVLAHFKQGWRGEVEVVEEIAASYMLASGGPAEGTPVLRDPVKMPLAELGRASTLDGAGALMRGAVLCREPDGRAESGVWECEPSRRAVVIERDEFCHVLAGCAVYKHASGERIEVRAGTIVFFPAGWRGTCENDVVFRKLYMTR